MSVAAVIAQAVESKNAGDSLYRDKSYQVAVVQYTKAINMLANLDSGNDDTAFQTLYVSYSNRCACFLQINSLQQALQDAQECVRLKPDWAKGFLRLANCYGRLQQKSDAIAAYEQVLAIEPGHIEAQQALQRLRQPRSSSSSRPSSTQPPPGAAAAGPTMMEQLQRYLLQIEWQRYWNNFQQQLAVWYAKAMGFWMSLSPDTQKYIQIGLVIFGLYYFFFYRSFGYDGGYGDSYYHGSYYQSYGYGGARGLSWTTWGVVMLAAYKLPPMFPDLLGPQYARPFFGMSWTTFMWLLNMVTQQRGGFGFGGMGGRPMHHFGRRRY